MKFIESDNLPLAIGPYSPAVKVNGMIYTSAQVPVTLDGTMVERDIKVQTRQVLSNLRTLLEDADSGMEKVIKVSIYLENIEDFGVVNVLFAEAFGEHKPARSTISVKSLPKNSLIMVDAIALSNDYH
ncbi:Rid family detoxifying hydrolase [Arcobacter aquimarinus]|uniref:Reactive intermediate/imine deaminase n=1 Tax=Arcobacter aquimarinus TaxID=1315211 RepID=A0AAE7E0C6_9BACT|nr:Rid family detoxifying hydrolase [Arcobacter aquimarinus]MCB9096846.1 deaminase [Arcobacter sp.]MCB9207405.1 deaminase [Ignavibacteriales bacterium]QKE25435.1 reactive intermediate/imine deaminase [Arcobacter aquimarinus]RXI35914.1 deaminase [Arcobacter aquimarinus]